jgi:AcrR family transcriptional regulator
LPSISKGYTSFDICYYICYICIVNTEQQTSERIVLAALGLFLLQGISKTTIGEVSGQAGVTRVTVYRHFSDKRGLVQAAFLRVAAIFQDVQAELEREKNPDVEDYLDRIGRELGVLPSGDLLTRLDELHRLYPIIYAEYHQAQLAALSRIFDRLFSVAEQQGLLRPGLNRRIAQAFYWEAIVGIMKTPSLVAHGLPHTEIYATVRNILLHGLFRDTKS